MTKSRCRAVQIGAPVGCVKCGNCETDYQVDEPDYSLKYDSDDTGDCGDDDGDEE